MMMMCFVKVITLPTLYKNTIPINKASNKGIIYKIKKKIMQDKSQLSHEVYVVFLFYSLTNNAILHSAWWWSIKTNTCACSSPLHTKHTFVFYGILTVIW